MAKKAKDWTKLVSYASLSFEEARETIQSSGHMLAFGNDTWALPVVRTFLDCEDKDAGMAALVAALFCQKHGPGSTAMMGMEIYRDIAKKQNCRALMDRVQNLEFMVYFAKHTSCKNLKWPMSWPYDDVRRMAGLANVMLGLALMRFSEPGASTSETVAAMGIQNFMDEGKEKLRKAG